MDAPAPRSLQEIDASRQQQQSSSSHMGTAIAFSLMWLAATLVSVQYPIRSYGNRKVMSQSALVMAAVIALAVGLMSTASSVIDILDDARVSASTKAKYAGHRVFAIVSNTVSATIMAAAAAYGIYNMGKARWNRVNAAPAVAAPVSPFGVSMGRL